MAEEAHRRAKAAGHLTTEAGLLAVEERIGSIRREVKAAKAARAALAKRGVPAEAAAAANRASQARVQFCIGAVVGEPIPWRSPRVRGSCLYVRVGVAVAFLDKLMFVKAYR